MMVYNAINFEEKLISVNAISFQKLYIQLKTLMASWLCILLLFFLGKSHAANPINQTDLEAAMKDMRVQSYHGFVILLKILNSIPNSLDTTDITFFMPNDQELSATRLTPDLLPDFVLSHSIPTALHLNQLLHFPNGTMVPSNIPNRMISITNTRRLDLLLNNARIVTPNVCFSSFIRCHGISTTIAFNTTFSSTESLPVSLPVNLRAVQSMAPQNEKKRQKSYRSTILKKSGRLPH